MKTMSQWIKLLKENIKEEAEQHDTGFARFAQSHIDYDDIDDMVTVDLGVLIYRKFAISGIEIRHHQGCIKNHIEMILHQFEQSVRQKIYEVLIDDIKPQAYGYELVADNAIPRGIIFCHPETVMNIRDINMTPHVVGEVVNAIAEGIKVEGFHDLSVKFKGEKK